MSIATDVTADSMVTDLVARARSGDSRAWDALVDRYAPLVWSICRKYRLDRADADDVAQSVCAAPGGPPGPPPRRGRAARLARHHHPAAMLARDAHLTRTAHDLF